MKISSQAAIRMQYTSVTIKVMVVVFSLPISHDLPTETQHELHLILYINIETGVCVRPSVQNWEKE